jgi:thiol-disulfide isomerase/thioredoxin
MKNFTYSLVLLFLFILFGCSSSKAPDDAPIITGKIEKAMLLNSTYPWFEKNYNEYAVNDDIIKSINEKKDNVSIMVFMGIWCGDSKREMPHFFKIMEKSNYTNFKVFGLNRKKTSPEGTESKYDIKFVPTFIFFKDGKELGRIVESPQKSLEEDILDIITKG